MRTGNQGDRMGLGESVVMAEPSEPIDNEKGDAQHVWDDEEEAVQYNYRLACKKIKPGLFTRFIRFQNGFLNYMGVDIIPIIFRSDWSYLMNFRVIGVVKSKSAKLIFCRNRKI